MKHICKLTVAVLLILAAILPLGLAAFGDEEEELKYMAYNFYSSPDLSATSKKFDSFMIDFRGTKTPNYTYWSLVNFSLDLTSLKTRSTYRNISGGGAYAGLQNRSETQGKAGILSFWETRYRNGKEEVIMTSTRIYPEGSSTFTGEGDGTNCIAPYEWKDDQWYRMLLHSWTDAETGTTFAGEWFLDVESGEWTLFSYFDTHLYSSFFTGGMSQFMENYWRYDVRYNCNAERVCNLKNMYVFDHVQKDWISLPTSKLSYGDGSPQREDQKKFGAHTFGATDEYFWGSTGGKVEDQAAYEIAATREKTYTISQPDKPTFQDPAATIESLGEDKVLTWTVPATAAPQLSYSIRAVDASGAVLFEKKATRPEVRSETLEGVNTDEVKCTLTVIDVFGGKATAEFETEAYKEAVKAQNETPTPDPTEEPTTEPETEPATESATVPAVETPAATESKSSENGKSKISPAVYVAVGVCAGVIAVVAVGVIVSKKKKKK